VRARKNGQADDLHVFLERGVDNHLRRLAESGIDYLHAGVAQRPGDYLGAAIMTVEAGFCHQHTDSRIHKLGNKRNAPQSHTGAKKVHSTFLLNRAPHCAPQGGALRDALVVFSIERIVAARGHLHLQTTKRTQAYK